MDRTPPCSPEVGRARVEWCKALLRTSDTMIGYLAKARAEFKLSKTQCYHYLRCAEAEVGGAADISTEDFDAAFFSFLFDQATDPTVSAPERRRTFETLARFLGRFKQQTASEAIVPAGPSTPSLTDPRVLAAALALDELVNSPESK